VSDLTFYLGTHHPHWVERVDFPLFIAYPHLLTKKGVLRRRIPEAKGPVGIDSGGYGVLKHRGRWPASQLDESEPLSALPKWARMTAARKSAREAAKRYADDVMRVQDEMGGGEGWAADRGVRFFAQQDWMCEPFVREGGVFKGQHFAGTGLSVRQHQDLTVENALDLRALAPGVRWLYAVQGYLPGEHARCAELFASAGIDLAEMPLVGLGSVCRRENTPEIGEVVRSLALLRLRLHGFGVKTGGLLRYRRHLASADSEAWSYHYRRRPPLPGCHHGKAGTGNCANCLVGATQWRDRLLGKLAAADAHGWQDEFEFGPAA
jgi:hypothetical protein